MGKLGEKAVVAVAVAEKGGEEDFIGVNSYVRGFLAVHKSIGPDGTPGDGWRITHTITGYLIRSYDTRAEAVGVRDLLYDHPEIDWEFTSIKDVAAPAVRRMQEFIRQAERMSGLKPREGDNEDHSMRLFEDSPPQAKGEESLAVSPEEEMMTMLEAAELIGIDRQRLYREVKRGNLPAMKIGGSVRVMRQDAEEYRDSRDPLEFEEQGIPEGAMTVREVADWLRYNPGHVKRMIRNEGFPAHRSPRYNGQLYFFKDEVMQFLKTRARHTGSNSE